MVILYSFINENKHTYLLDKYLNDNSEIFKIKILRYRRWQDAQLSLLGRVLLKYGLRNYYHDVNETDIYLTSYNKPFLKGQNIYFNISHSENLVVCIIARFPVGIDVEFLNESINYRDFRSQMTLKEFDEIYNADDKIKSFFNFWTKKEAVIKADGRGLKIPLQSIELVDDECIIDKKRFFVKEISINENYLGHIASDHIDIVNDPLIFEEFFSE